MVKKSRGTDICVRTHHCNERSQDTPNACGSGARTETNPTYAGGVQLKRVKKVLRIKQNRHVIIKHNNSDELYELELLQTLFKVS